MRLWCALAIGLLGALPTHAQQLPPVHFYFDTAYMCGGIGSDEAESFRTAQANFPLTLNFGQQYGDRTAFIADIQVVMRDNQDQVVLNINSNGPYCLLDIDPGQYQVYSTYEGQTLRQDITVNQLGHRLVFVWPEDPNQ